MLLHPVLKYVISCWRLTTSKWQPFGAMTPIEKTAEVKLKEVLLVH